MTNILDSFRRLFKHRHHQRYVVRNGTCVIISHSKGEGKKVQVIDISEGGMAFVYEGPKTDLDKFGMLKLFASSDVKFDTVTDVPVSDNAQSPGKFRRRSVKFEWMGTVANADLNAFIDENKLCEK